MQGLELKQRELPEQISERNPRGRRTINQVTERTARAEARCGCRQATNAHVTLT